MNVLVACEESQTVTSAFRALGANAFSCDIKSCSGGHPEWHYQCDCFDVIEHPPIGIEWDLLIAHPPCTYITKAGACNFYMRDQFESRLASQREAVDFFMRLYDLPIKKICIENPVPMKMAGLPPWTQVIYPELFGSLFTKQTCLWLKGLPPLLPYFTDSCLDLKSLCAVKRSAAQRSKFPPEVAKAMAEQWIERM